MPDLGAVERGAPTAQNNGGKAPQSGVARRRTSRGGRTGPASARLVSVVNDATVYGERAPKRHVVDDCPALAAGTTTAGDGERRR
jgi:hypothetical protein